MPGLAPSVMRLQIYFDFSGYSDMAIGLALMMGITFPLNFNSPYKAASMIEFWRRWHMTLSRFLRDDLYIPLGGNRKGRVRRYANLMITMLIGGLWHGASWNFLVWGGIHGVGLALNHLWRDLPAGTKLALPRAVAAGATMLWVLFAWVPFRADTFGSTRFDVAEHDRRARICGAIESRYPRCRNQYCHSLRNRARRAEYPGDSCARLAQTRRGRVAVASQT